MTKIASLTIDLSESVALLDKAIDCGDTEKITLLQKRLEKIKVEISAERRQSAH